MGPIICICGGIGGELPARANGLARNCEAEITSTREPLASAAALNPSASLPPNALLIVPALHASVSAHSLEPSQQPGSSAIASARCAYSPCGLRSALNLRSTVSVVTTVDFGEVRATTLSAAPGCFSAWGTTVEGRGKTTSSMRKKPWKR